MAGDRADLEVVGSDFAHRRYLGGGAGDEDFVGLGQFLRHDGALDHLDAALARRRQYKIVERAVWPKDLARAQEVFLTGTAAEVTPVGEVGEHKFTPGEITRNLMEDYATLVRAKPAQAA